MAKRLSFGGPSEAAPQPGLAAAPQPGFAAALAAVEAGPGAGMDPELEKKLRRQSMDGTLPVSLNALRVRRFLTTPTFILFVPPVGEGIAGGWTSNQQGRTNAPQAELGRCGAETDDLLKALQGPLSNLSVMPVSNDVAWSMYANL